MKADPTVLVVGAGALGSALVRGAAKDPARRARIQVLDAVEARAHSLAEETGVGALKHAQLTSPFDLVLVVVKPPDVTAALEQVRAAIGPQTVLVSCAAGVTMASITFALGGAAKIVRAMPNVAARVQASATVLVAGAEVTEEERAQVEALFKAVGQVHQAPSEEALHAATALAASGPAFLALALEALMDGGVGAGLSRPLAEELTLGMASGTLALLADGTSPAELRAQVTSPAGTTAAGLAELERTAVRGAIGDAIAAAARRSRELGS